MSSQLFTLCKMIVSMLFIFIFAATVQGQNLNPALEQEFLDAKAALQKAQAVRADIYAPDKLKEATEFLTRADRARLANNEAEFSQASHMARALAEFAAVSSELRIEREKRAAIQSELQNVKDEIQRLEKAR